MSNKCICLLILLFSGLFIGNAQAQTSSKTRPETLRTDSIASESKQGNLQELTQQVYLAFRAYSTGTNRLTRVNDHPFVFKYNENFYKSELIDFEELKNIPTDSVESVEAVYEPKGRGALYGMQGQICIIVVKFKSK